MKPLQTYFPFSPPIGHAELPEEMVNDLNNGCDDIVKDEELAKSADFSRQLVGQVEQELLIPQDIIQKWANWFASQILIYSKNHYDQLFVPNQNVTNMSKKEVYENVDNMKIKVQSAWYVRSFDGDYNPVHIHTGCTLTCVGFLKVPDLSKERIKHNLEYQRKYSGDGPAGNLEVLGNNSQGPWEHNRIALMPEIGNWYLFPSNIRHAVYPFRNDGERRSFSINFDTRLPWDNPPNFNKE